ncbi:hypothetical protein ASG68_22850 [Rhizobium sp. Leaf453]|nr:hypothetical protein ASG68_22850 [Rhizobium sp. Leaf453]
MLAAAFGLPALYDLEQGVVDDPQMRGAGLLVIRLIVHARHAAAGGRVFHHPNPVPDNFPGIDRIAQDTVPPLAVAVDRRGVPLCSSRCRYRFAVQRARDCPRRKSIPIHLENAAHRAGLGFHDLQFSGFTDRRRVAVGLAASVTAGANHANHPALDLLRAFLSLHLADDAIHSDLKRLDLSAVDAVDLD